MHIQDGAFQTELAIDGLWQGQNPYTRVYSELQFSDFHDPRTGQTRSYPARTHFVYLPGTILTSLPVSWLSQLVIGWYDQRVTHAIAMLVSLAILLSFCRRLRWKLVAAAAWIFNPLWLPFLLQGHNDILVCMWLLAAAAALRKQRWILAAMLLGVAVATKQTAWFALPFFGLYAWPRIPARQRIQSVVWLSGTALVLLLPFVLWNPAAFVDDTWRFATGGLPTSWPIWGVGFAKLLYRMNFIHSIFDTYPFWIWQLVVGVPTMWWLWRWQARHNSLANALIATLGITFVLLFFSRYFNTNSIGYLSLLGFSVMSLSYSTRA